MPTGSATGNDFGILFLHALPFDGTMWDGIADIAPGATYAPTLYDSGPSLENWAHRAMENTRHERLIVVGCSVGGSCALEIAAAYPNRVAEMILIGTKADHRQDPRYRDTALDLIAKDGLAVAWDRYWAPLFSKSTAAESVESARRAAIALTPQSVSNGVAAFHGRPSRGNLIAHWPGPVTVITGDEDTAPGLAASAALANAAPNGTLIVVPGCGHYVPLEKPGVLKSVLLNKIQRL